MQLPNFYYVMVLINKDNELVQYPYYVINDEFYEKLKTHIILYVIKVVDKKIKSYEKTPIKNINSGYIPPRKFEPDDKIWRYMDFYKFEDLVQTSALYMSRIDMFPDNLEGISPESCKNSILSESRLDDEEMEQQLELFNERTAINRKNGFVCCWHLNKSLNPTMWQEYGKDNSDSVAIETTTGQLRKSFTNTTLPLIYEYIRYFDEPFFNQETYWFPSLFKRREFEYEQEFRCAIYAANLYGAKFTRLNLNLEHLITKIHLHPNAKIEQVNKIKKMLNDKNLKIAIEINKN
jgi:hypothetical protein